MVRESYSKTEVEAWISRHVELYYITTCYGTIAIVKAKVKREEDNLKIVRLRKEELERLETLNWGRGIRYRVRKKSYPTPPLILP